MEVCFYKNWKAYVPLVIVSLYLRLDAISELIS
jgi:hypothetical protein